MTQHSTASLLPLLRKFYLSVATKATDNGGRVEGKIITEIYEIEENKYHIYRHSQQKQEQEPEYNSFRVSEGV